MENKILKWNNDNCLIGYKWSSQCWFDGWSIMHFIVTAIIYLIILVVIHKFVKKNKLKWALWSLIILNVLHTIEDILENMRLFSLEYFLLGIYDYDSFQNFIGDILSGVVGSVIVFIMYLIINK